MEKLLLYRQLIKACRRFTDYNFKEYFLRRTREDFRSSGWANEKSEKQLEIIKRQALIQSMYPTGKSIIESVSPTKLGYSSVLGKEN